ncbi:Uncharacterised protein [Comamonas terrigena]|nr:Uncharacterised protein [Comamonas terrigena]
MPRLRWGPRLYGACSGGRCVHWISRLFVSACYIARMRSKALPKSRQNATGLTGYLAGNYPLRTVFWGFGLGGGGACMLAMYALATHLPYMQATAWQFGLLYAFGWWRATWKSAGQYAGPLVWQRGAKAAVVATAVLTMGMAVHASRLNRIPFSG